MTPSWVLFLLLMLVTTSLEWVIKVKKGVPVGMPQVRHGGFTLRRRGPMQRIPHRLKHIFSGFESSRQTLDRTNIDHFGGIGSGHQKDTHSQQYGQFNSDVVRTLFCDYIPVNWLINSLHICSILSSSVPLKNNPDKKRRCL